MAAAAPAPSAAAGGKSDVAPMPRAHPQQKVLTNPVVFFDVSIGGHNAGRVVMELL